MTKIFNYPWHIAHQYDLAKIPDTEWSWLVQHRRSYSAFPRDDFFSKYNFEWVPYYEPGKYDVAILHLDQQCFEPGIAERGKGSLFLHVNSVVDDIPKIVIMHGTPFYPESFKSDITKDNYKGLGFTEDQIGMSSELIHLFNQWVEDIDFIIFNSHTAQKQWGYANSPKARTIWHGMDEEEWYNLPKEPRVVTMISPGGLDAYYDRTFLRGVKELLQERDIEHCHITVDASFKNWEEYRQFLGRSLLYFNPTKESPMPRSRTEAMMSGCCVLTTPHQDADMFVENGVNGILVPRNPNVVADLIEGLLHDYKKAVEIGNRGRETAKKVFNAERYRSEWREVLEMLTK